MGRAREETKTQRRHRAAVETAAESAPPTQPQCRHEVVQPAVQVHSRPRGNQQNRRVELVISGEVIGTETGTPIAVR
jgi:hypothetical protein